MAQSDSPVPSGRVRRTMPLAGFTARAGGGRVVAGLRERAGDDGAVERFHERTAERYAELLGHSKGLLMKAGQIMSLVDAQSLGTGGFGPYQKALSRLQADAPPMHSDLVHSIVEAELGSRKGEFAEFCDEPMAAASIGQVHRATLRDGQQVAVKIQYPGVADVIRDDLANTEMLATFLRFLGAASGTTSDFRAGAREVAARIAEEVDYRHEAEMIESFSQLYHGHPFIRVPELVPRLSADRVLTMTYLDGVDWAAAQKADQGLKNTWAEIVVRCNYGNFRHANFFQADPHPGNYRFAADGTVGFVDFGCVKFLSERKRWLMVAMTRAAIEGRKQDYRDIMVEAGFVPVDSDLTADELHAWQQSLIYEISTATQPVRYTPDTTARTVRAMFDVRQKDHPMARMNAPDDYIFISRHQLSGISLCVGLNATLPIRAIMDDLDGVSEPVTELGKLHHAWVRERRLPLGLDHHDAG